MLVSFTEASLRTAGAAEYDLAPCFLTGAITFKGATTFSCLHLMVEPLNLKGFDVL